MLLQLECKRMPAKMIPKQPYFLKGKKEEVFKGGWITRTIQKTERSVDILKPLVEGSEESIDRKNCSNCFTESCGFQTVFE